MIPLIAIIGQLTPPAPFTTAAGQYGGVDVGLIKLINNLVRLIIAIGGLWAFLNLVLAGYGFLGAENDPKKIEGAWAKIWQSAIGLVIMLGSFVLAAIFGSLLFGNPKAILQPIIYGPGTP